MVTNKPPNVEAILKIKRKKMKVLNSVLFDTSTIFEIFRIRCQFSEEREENLEFHTETQRGVQYFVHSRPL